MKKLVTILFVLALVAMLPLSAFAATGINEYEQAVLDKLSTSHVIGENGWDFSVPQEYINTAKNYFAGDGEMTEAEMNVILSKIDAGMAVVKKEADAQTFSGTEYKLSSMSETARDQILDLGQEACAEIDLNLVYDPKADDVIITPVGSNTPVFESAPVVKTTGEDFPMTAGLIAVAVVAVLAVGSAVMFGVSKKNGLLV